ncbi:MAG: peptide chain release factor N(5)-glutamine methyltransferase [Planctomycetaceae bacterium]|jgi:release factor glutamine methyltransferase|nr:peptide chain release factor N(5)-glutamine methyltransferase [Planctomycetaceae bacterium]
MIDIRIIGLFVAKVAVKCRAKSVSPLNNKQVFFLLCGAFMSQAEQWTVKRLLEWTTEYFKKNHVNSPRLDAEILLAQSLGCKRIDLYIRFSHEPSEAERARFRELLKRHTAGEPVAYLVGYKEFYSLPFEVTRDTLIPRPETEHLVIESLDLLAKMSGAEDLSVCDVGTGSGAIAVTIAKNAPKCRITAVDISNAALEVAKRNAQKHEVAKRIVFLTSDLLSAFPEQPIFDLIVSNPPYVSETEYERLPPDVKNYEPKSALIAAEDGMAAIRQLAEQALSRLRKNGFFLTELSPMIAERITETLQKSRWQQVRILRDLAGRERVAVAQL